MSDEISTLHDFNIMAQIVLLLRALAKTSLFVALHMGGQGNDVA
jgi:hypothetical protein